MSIVAFSLPIQPSDSAGKGKAPEQFPNTSLDPESPWSFHQPFLLDNLLDHLKDSQD